MALIQALIRLVTQTVGRILSALLDWAVVSLFGRVTGNRKLFLWGMMACAAAWPVLLLGVIVGTYSSVFVASPVLVVWHVKAGGKLIGK